MNIETLTASLKNLLHKNNTTTATLPSTTTTADISDGLKSRITGIQIGVDKCHENMPVPYTAFPLVFVEAVNTQDNFEQLGRTNRREIIVNWNIVGLTQYGIGSADERKSRENADIEIMRLSENIETLLRNYISLSSTVDWCRIQNVNYNAKVRESTYNSSVSINLIAKVRQ